MGKDSVRGLRIVEECSGTRVAPGGADVHSLNQRKSLGARRLLSTVFALIFCPLCIPAGMFEEANELYDGGRFLEARQRYQELVERGEWSANLFYNLGNAHYRLGAPGLAMLNYERALALDRSHPEALANLKLLREQTHAKVSERSWVERLFSPFSTDALAMLAAIAIWSAIFFLLALVIRGRAAGAWSGLVASVLIAIYSVTGVWQRERNSSLAVITANNAEARLAPADRAGLAESLAAGSRIRILSERGEWIYCALPGKGLGWIRSTSLERVRLSRS